jgi:hypothetical protein
MKLKRLLSLVGLLAALLVFTSGRALAADAIAVEDAFAFPGGSDTVDVLVTTDAEYPGAEITLSYDASALSTTEASVIVNESAWDPSWGAPQVSVDTAAGTIKVGLTSLTDVTARIPQSSSALKLFSVIFGVDSSATTGSYTITPSGTFVAVDENYELTEITVTALTAGTLTVQSLYSMSVDSVDTGPGVMTPVGVNLTNGREAVSVEFTIAYDSSQVVYADSIEINDLYVGGSASAPEVTDFGDSLKVAIYTISAATIPVSNTSRWIARVYMVSADSAMESESNPLTLTTNTTVVTRDENYNPVENSPGTVPGNINIQSPFALSVGDAAAPLGGSDTVVVYLRSSETVVGFEAELMFDSDNFTVSESNVAINSALFGTGSPYITDVTVTDSTVQVLATAQPTDSIAASPNERMMFSVILGVKDSATTGYDSLNASATLTQRDENYNPTEVVVTSITKGAFRIQAPYELAVRSRNAGPKAKNVEVGVLLTNQADLYSGEVVIKFDTTEVSYVDGSVMLNADLWSGTVPTPEIIAGGDSVKIGFLDLSDVNNMIAGGSANRELLTVMFDLDSTLAVGDTAWLTPSGLLAGRDANYNPVEYIPTGVVGYIAVSSDIVPPGPVTNATATVDDVTGTVTLSWKNPTATDLDYVKVQRRLGNDTVMVVTRDTPVPGATDIYEELNVPEGTYNYDFMVADLNGNMGNVVTLEVVVGEGGVPTENSVRVSSRVARVGGVAKPKILLSNMEQIAGLSLKLTFDNTALILMDVTPGADAAGLSPVSAVDIDAANTSGELMLDMIDLSTSDPVMPGTDQVVAMLEFVVDSSAVVGTVAALTLSDVSLSDPDGNDVALTTTSGAVTIQADADNDLNDDGSVNIGDIWYYLNMEEMVQFESLVELIAALLAQPMPSTLASVQDAVATNYRVDGNVALIDLATDYEIVAARFTFSYDTMYQFESIGLNPALAGQLMIKKVVADGKIYVDVIALGGFVPAEVGEIFSVAFRDTDHQTAGLTLEQVQTADRDGNVRIEAAKVNRIALPKAYSLSQNSPNPFNPSTTIKYQVPEGEAARVQIVVYNIRGQKVVTLVDELKESGDYSVNWNGQSSSGQRVSSGVYFYRMSAGEFSAMRKMVIVK